MAKIKRTKGQTMIYKTLDKKLNTEQHKPNKKTGVNSSICLFCSVVTNYIFEQFYINIHYNLFFF